MLTFNCLSKNEISIFFVFLLLFSSFSYAEKNKNIHIEAVPSWAESRDFIAAESIPIDEITDGVFYQLLDTQKKITSSEKIVSHSRYIKTIINQVGVDRSSQINLDFDPTYQKLALNTLYILRDGKRIDKLSSAKISLLNRETELENQIYNGSLTMNILIDDIQVDDSIDYSFTRYGSNPVYKGIFAYTRTLNWSEPVHEQYVRILWGKASPLFVNTRNISAEINQKKIGNFTEYQIQMLDAETLSISSEIPSWYEPYGSVSFSESESWEDVVVWAKTLYQPSELHQNIVELAKDIKQQNVDQSDQIAAALQYTQDNIRYVGLEMGVNSHLPTPAHETLALKYGDCKDKALLFITILKALGIDAYPALVNTEETKLLAERLPAVNLFDHVIVTLELKGERIWLDPTLSYQEGRLTQLFQPDYGYALVVKSGETALTSMASEHHNSYIHIIESYVIPESVNEAVTYGVMSDYLGDEAQKKSSQIERDGKKKLEQDYEIHYQSTYPKLTTSSPILIVQDPLSGVLKLSESYSIEDFWEKGDKDYERNFYPSNVRNAVYKPKHIKRNAPLWLDYPNNIINKINIEFKEKNWEFDDSTFVEDNDFFFFKRNVAFADNILSLTYEYSAKTDHVPANKIEDYLTARDSLRDNAYYGITKYAEQTEDEVKESDEVTWLVIGIWTYVIGLVFILVSWRIESSKRPEFADSYFSPIALSKFMVLSLVTFGTYSTYWMYRNWKAIKQSQQSDMMPIARGIFSIIWFYPLFSALQKDSIKRFTKNKVMMPFLAVLSALIYFVFSVTSNYIEQTALSLLALLLPLLFIPFVLYINDINNHNSEAYRYNSKWNIRSIIAIIIFLPIFGFAIAQETPFIPSDSVISQNDIMQHDMKYLYRKNVVPVDETINYFYSDAFLSLRDDGNGFTDKRVFSYWQDDDEGFQSEMVLFENIKDITVKYAEEKDGNTIITMTRLDDTNFKLFVSSVKEGDKLFVDKLKLLWNESK